MSSSVQQVFIRVCRLENDTFSHVGIFYPASKVIFFSFNPCLRIKVFKIVYIVYIKLQKLSTVYVSLIEKS